MCSFKIVFFVMMICLTNHISSGLKKEGIYKPGRLWYSTKYPSIVQAAITKPSLKTLVTAVVAADLVDTLATGGPFTVFAPRNSAFMKIPSNALNSLLENKSGLTKVLLRHVIPSEIKSWEIPNGSTELKTVGGEMITVTKSGGSVMIESSAGKARVTRTDIATENGVIHVVDSVF